MRFAADYQREPVALTLHGFARPSSATGPAPSSANLEGHRQAATDPLEVGHSAWGMPGAFPNEHCHTGPQR